LLQAALVLFLFSFALTGAGMAPIKGTHGSSGENVAIIDHYATLPKTGCPSQAGFSYDHFAAIAPVLGSKSSAPLQVFRGGAPTQPGVECLRSMGVSTIIDVRSDGEVSPQKEPSWAKGAGIQYLRFPMATDSSVPSASCKKRGLNATQCNAESVDGAIHFLGQAESGNPGEKIYIHCARGEDRSGLVVGAYRFLVQKASKTAARNEMAKFGFTPYAVLNTVWNELH
jgi:hypothetical protein